MTFGIVGGIPVALGETVDGWMMIALGTLCVVAVSVAVGTIEYGAELLRLGGGDATVIAIDLEVGGTVEDGRTPVPELIGADGDIDAGSLLEITVEDTTIEPELAGEVGTMTAELDTAVPLEIGELDTTTDEGVEIGIEALMVILEIGSDDRIPEPVGRLITVEEIGIDRGIDVGIEVGMIEERIPVSLREGRVSGRPVSDDGRVEEMGTTVTRPVPLSPRLIEELRIGTAVSVAVGTDATDETNEETSLPSEESTGRMPSPAPELLEAAVIVASVEDAGAAEAGEEPPRIVERPTRIPPVELDTLAGAFETAAADAELDVGKSTVDGRRPVEPTIPPSKFVVVAAVVSVESAASEELEGCTMDCNAGSRPIEEACEVAACVELDGNTTDAGNPPVEPTAGAEAVSAAVVVSVDSAAGVVSSAGPSVVVSAVDSIVGFCGEAAGDELDGCTIDAGNPPVEPTATA